MAETVVDNAAAHRFELEVDGHRALAAYRLQDGVMTFSHTEVPPELSGRGVAGKLIGGALEQVAARGLKVIPACSFVASYMDKHPETAALRADG